MKPINPTFHSKKNGRGCYLTLEVPRGYLHCNVTLTDVTDQNSPRELLDSVMNLKMSLGLARPTDQQHNRMCRVDLPDDLRLEKKRDYKCVVSLCPPGGGSAEEEADVTVPMITTPLWWIILLWVSGVILSLLLIWGVIKAGAWAVHWIKNRPHVVATQPDNDQSLTNTPSRSALGTPATPATPQSRATDSQNVINNSGEIEKLTIINHNYFGGSGRGESQRNGGENLGWPYGSVAERTEGILDPSITLPPGTEVKITKILPGGKDYSFLVPVGYKINARTSCTASEIQGMCNCQSLDNPRWVDWLGMTDGQENKEFRFKSLVGRDITIVFTLTAN